MLKGDNSFGTLAQLQAVMIDMPGVEKLKAADHTSQQQALSQAFFNMDALRVTVYNGVESFYRVGDMDEADMELLEAYDARQWSSLKRAQVIEANFLLGGNPVEDRRRMGLISDSTGESAHFFRTSKPLILAVSRECAQTLRGIIDYSAPTTRG